PRHLEHRRRDVGADDPEPEPAKKIREHARPAGCVEHDATRPHAGEPLREGALEQPVIEPAHEAAVAALLVAARVEAAIAPSRVVIRILDRRRSHGALLTSPGGTGQTPAGRT